MKTYVPAHVIKGRARLAWQSAQFCRRRADAARARGADDAAAKYDTECKVQTGIHRALVALYDSNVVSEELP